MGGVVRVVVGGGGVMGVVVGGVVGGVVGV